MGGPDLGSDEWDAARRERDLAGAFADARLERAVSWLSDAVTPHVAMALAIGGTLVFALILTL